MSARGRLSRQLSTMEFEACLIACKFSGIVKLFMYCYGFFMWVASLYFSLKETKIN